MTTSYISLADFAESFGQDRDAVPDWVHPDALSPLPLDNPVFRHRLEELIDTVVSLQRAEWLQDGIYVGPSVMGEVYRDVLACARTLRIAVPPALVGGGALRSQGAFGTDARAFLYLSSYFFDAATEAERMFMAGRMCGHVAARQVTEATLYALLVDHSGLRQLARRSVGPMLEVFLAPLSLGLRLALSRWHRAAEITADRAGMLCAGTIEGAGRALLRVSLGMHPTISPEDYMQQLRTSRESGPGRWTELLASEPWMHKRMAAIELFAQSRLWAEHTGQAPEGPLLELDELNRRTTMLLGVR
jgi:Zn-dependent protease with chaperone function